MSSTHSNAGSPQMQGVSVVVCCHNSAARLPDTLRCLAAQKSTQDISWEVIVVDNSSTDDTAAIAQACWPIPAPAPLRIVNEPDLGLSHARVRGFDTARYEYISLVDDDNRVAEDWVARVYQVMNFDPAIGACGGRITADFESPPPAWWHEYAGCYAVGDQWNEEGDITDSKGWLYGAGLTVRLSAWRHLREHGFRFRTSDRQGAALAGGGDNELCYALRQSGWKLWLDWSLHLRHLIPTGRMQWDYLRRLFRASGETALTLDAYRHPSSDPMRTHWLWQTLSAVKQLLLHPADFLNYLIPKGEGKESVLRTEARVGKLAGLLRLRGKYTRTWREIQESTWRKHCRPVAAPAPTVIC